MSLNVKKSGLTLGILFGAIHFVWIILVTATNGWIVEVSMSIHNVGMEHTYMPFDFISLIIGVIGAFIIGVVIGGLFALIWNKLG